MLTSICRKTKTGTIYREYSDGSFMIGASRYDGEPYTVLVMVDVSAQGYREMAAKLGDGATDHDVIDALWRSAITDAAQPSPPPHP